jgi:hypothetical protein
MRKDLWKIWMVLISLVSVTGVQSQELEAGVMAGGNYYNGDIIPGMMFRKVKPNYGAMVRYNLDTRLSVRASLSRGAVGADEAIANVRPERMASFDASLTEISTTAEFNFMKYFTGSSKHRISPYLFGGVGYFFYNGDVTALADGNNYAESYSGSGMTVPFGIGFKLSLTRTLCLTTDWGYRKLFTDNLDGLPEYYNIGSENDPELIQLSNAATNDWYAFAGISLSLRLDVFKKDVCRDLQRGF